MATRTLTPDDVLVEDAGRTRAGAARVDAIDMLRVDVPQDGVQRRHVAVNVANKGNAPHNRTAYSMGCQGAP